MLRRLFALVRVRVELRIPATLNTQIARSRTRGSGTGVGAERRWAVSTGGMPSWASRLFVASSFRDKGVVGGVVSGGRQWTHTDPLGSDNGEVAGPVRPAVDNRRDHTSDLCWRGHGEAKQHDAARSGEPGAPRQLAKVLVERQENAVLLLRAGQHVRVGTPRRVGANPGDVVTREPQREHGVPGDVFVCQQAHRRMGQPRVRGYTFSAWRTSLAYCRQAAMSSRVRPG